jgi:hypothetical protein
MYYILGLFAITVIDLVYSFSIRNIYSIYLPIYQVSFAITVIAKQPLLFTFRRLNSVREHIYMILYNVREHIYSKVTTAVYL